MSADNCFDYTDLESQVSFGGSRKKKKRRRRSTSRSAVVASSKPRASQNQQNSKGGIFHRNSPISIFKKNYDDNLKSNIIGGDKYFHCKANAESARNNIMNVPGAIILSTAKEAYDIARHTLSGDPRYSDSKEDMGANMHGLSQGILSPNKSPKDICKGYRPNGLDEKF